MPPLPKRKLSRARQAKRMSHVAYQKPTLSRCPTCQNLKRPHLMCPICGHYDGREVKAPKTRGDAEA